MNREEELKIRLFAEGLRIAPSAERVLVAGHHRPISMRDYASTSGIILRLGFKVFVNAPVYEPFCLHSPHELVYEDGLFLVRSPLGAVPCYPVPIPALFTSRGSKGQLHRDYGITHTDRIRVSPVAGCAFRCEFCDLPYTTGYARKEIPLLVETVQAALKDPRLPAAHVLVSGGTPRAGDAAYLDASVEAVARSAGVPVDVMMVPRADTSFIPRYHSWGVTGVFFNMELHDPGLTKRIAPQKARLSNPHLLRAIEEAVEVFDRGQVRSLLLVGLEPPSETLAGVRELVERGCIPVLSPFRPAPATPLADHPPPSAELLRDVYERVYELCKTHGMRPGPACVPCSHNTLTFDDGSGAYMAHGDPFAGLPP